MKILSITEISELKNILCKEFNTILHMHDCCGGQFFSSDTALNDLAVEYITGFLTKRGLGATFSCDRLSFTVKEARKC